MIKIKEIDPKFANADAETKRQLFEIALAEALKSAVNEEQMNNFVSSVIEKSAYNLLSGIRKELANKADKSELPKPSVFSTTVDLQPAFKTEPKKEVQSTSWKEKLIKLLQK